MATANPDHAPKCTLIETVHGEVKLIKRATAGLTTLNFPNLKNCLDFADKNQFQINIVHSGRKREDRKSPNGQVSS
jgi:hypothetical protein